MSFQRTQVAETSLSDYHKLITTFFKSRLQRHKPENICYRNYKNFSESASLKTLFCKDPHEGYDTVTNNILAVVNKQAPLKKENI